MNDVKKHSTNLGKTIRDNAPIAISEFKELAGYIKSIKENRSKLETLEVSRTTQVLAPATQGCMAYRGPMVSTPGSEAEWVDVVGRKKKDKKRPNYQDGAQVKDKGKRKRRRTISEAVLIKPATGSSFAEVVRNIRADVKPEDMAVDIRAIKTTRQGDV